MRNIQRVLPIFLLLSLIIHCLLLYMIILANVTQKKNDKSPLLYQPAYLYQGSLSPPVSHSHTNMTDNSLQLKSSSNETIANKEAIALNKKQLSSTPNKKIRTRSVMSMTYQFLNQYQQEYTHAFEEAEPIYLVGDLKSPVDPLVRLLGRALSKHFHYPQVAGMFGIKGRALVSLVLHPSGEISHVRLMQSTENHDLDSAALYAVNNAPLVKGVDKFLSKPKRFVVAFVFRQT